MEEVGMVMVMGTIENMVIEEKEDGYEKGGFNGAGDVENNLEWVEVD